MPGRPVGRRMDGLDLLRRAWRPDEPIVALEGASPTVAALPAASLCVRDGRVWTRAGAGAWAPRDEAPWDAVRAFLRGGLRTVALLGYDAGRLVERIPATARDDTRLPEVLLLRFDAAWIEGELRGAEGGALAERAKGDPLPLPAGAVGPLEPATPRAAFEAMVRQVKAHVRAGDVFQVNLSHRLEADCAAHPLALYARLGEANPAPFRAFLQTGPLPEDPHGFSVVSASPERLVRVARGKLEARPIAGTRPRGATPEEDRALAAELAADGKERAEHAMMVDLARNDLGRVARFGSVRVPRFAAVESYRTVHHLVSTVEADLAPDRDAVDVIRALFPGGTITGAPKVRAMEVIEALEPTRRGIYTGSLGWIDPSGDLDLNILIRTLLVRRGRLHLQVGAGIVEESDPAREHAETLAKAKGVLLGLGAAAP
jgi:para-aminobenzoate synthetase component I